MLYILLLNQRTSSSRYTWQKKAPFLPVAGAERIFCCQLFWKAMVCTRETQDVIVFSKFFHHKLLVSNHKFCTDSAACELVTGMLAGPVDSRQVSMPAISAGRASGAVPRVRVRQETSWPLVTLAARRPSFHAQVSCTNSGSRATPTDNKLSGS